MRNLVKSLRASEAGTTVVEFAIVAPVFVALLVGALTLCLGLFLIGSLHYAVEEAARCASVKTTVCADPATTIAYARNHYYGPDLSPSFAYAIAECGKSVSAAVSYSMNIGFKTFVIPMSATACFP
ncbi:TadE/TadG family type IV pilus assembly protein [Bradyrhizobium sp. ORS 111]|uniref:TadE/TadG family type IV pilus assembly protein n=1 Tax=Bradyrhizobium sp. ORS 111 TaxID=1685958 RepID=UPI00388DEA68